MKHLLAALILITFSLSAYASDFNGACACKKLSDVDKKIAAEILKSRHPYDCCDMTLAECMGADNRCRLAVRLTNMVCAMVDKGKDKQAIVSALEKRAMTMTPSFEKIDVDDSTAMVVGEADAPVFLTAYLCVRCPYCAKLTPNLYKEITEGSLKGKVRLSVKLFPIKGHEGSTESGIAAMAAVKQSKGFPFLLHAYEHFDEFGVDKLSAWAAAVGMNMETYNNLYNDPATRKALVDSKKEGLKNKVKATPTLFLNGRRYLAPMDIDTVKDVLEEEYERKMGLIMER